MTAPANLGVGHVMSDESAHGDPDEEWIFVVCHNRACSRPLLISPVAPDLLDENRDLTLRAGDVAVACAHCQTQSNYRPEELRRGRAKRP
jgi:hypothetical protein